MTNEEKANRLIKLEADELDYNKIKNIITMEEKEVVKYIIEQHQRNQEIDRITNYLSIPEKNGFVAGVKWADKHPIDEKNKYILLAYTKWLDKRGFFKEDLQCDFPHQIETFLEMKGDEKWK